MNSFNQEVRERAKFFQEHQQRIYLEVINELPPGTPEEYVNRIFSRRYLELLREIF